MRHLFLITLCGLLGGCFYSEDPLIGRFRADFPMEVGVYAHTPYHPDGRPFDRPTWTGEIERSGGRYSSDVENFPHEGVRMREIAPGRYAVMKPDGAHYLYGIAFAYPGGVMTYHQPSCADLSAAARARYDVEEHAEEPGYCRVGDWDRLSAVLLSYLEEAGDSLRIDGVYRLAV